MADSGAHSESSRKFSVDMRFALYGKCLPGRIRTLSFSTKYVAVLCDNFHTKNYSLIT